MTFQLVTNSSFWIAEFIANVCSDAYTFLFEPNPDWSQFYPTQPEIQAYIKATVAKYNLDKYVSLKSKVLETRWDDDLGKWKIKIDANGVLQETTADILVNGSGFLKSVPICVSWSIRGSTDN